MTRQYAYPHAERLTRKVEFDRVFKSGRAYRTPDLSILSLPNGTPRSRLGMVVGRRMGAAPTRSRMKRLIREAFRLNSPLRAAGLDLVVMPRETWKALRLAVVQNHLQGFLESLAPKERR